jgi:hypothetical protein
MRPTSGGILALLAIIVSVSSANAFNPVAVVVADLDGNGSDDAAVLGDAEILLIRSNGDRTFGAFNPATVGTKSTGGFAIASGFFDNNSSVDLVVTNEAQGNVSVLLGNGDGTFKAARLNIVGASPEGVVAAKLNGGASQDIAVVDNGELADLNVSLLYGNNNGTFNADQRTTAATISVGIAAADLDQDGSVDLAVTNISGGGGVAVLRNDPGCSDCAPPSCDCTRGFDLKELAGINEAEAIQAGNLNGDAKPDLAVLSQDGQDLAIFTNTTTGTNVTFSVSHLAVSLASDSPLTLILADVNKDGHPDILAINDTNAGVDIFLNNGSGGFPTQPSSTLSIGENLVAIASGDFDKDGNPDIVLVDDSAQKAYFFFGDGVGGFPNEQDFDLSSVPTDTATATPVGPTNTPSPTVIVSTPTPTPTFTPAPTLTPTPIPTPYGVCNTNDAGQPAIGGTPVAVAVGKFNSDADPDIAVAVADGRIVLLTSHINSGAMSPCAALGLSHDAGKDITGIDGPVALAAADLNGDGKLDLAVVGTAGLSVFFGDGDGAFSASSSNPMAAGTKPMGLAIANFNRDEFPDIIVANEHSDDVSIFVGTGQGHFALPCSVSIGYPATGVVAADLNHDGRADFAVFSDQANHISVFLQIVPSGTGTPTPTPGNACPSGTSGFRVLKQTDLPVNFASHALVVDQFDLTDTTPDFAVALSSTTGLANGQAQVLLGQAAAGQSVNYTTGASLSLPSVGSKNSEPSAIGAGDINQDGRSDIVVADKNNNQIVVFLANPGGTFMQLAPIDVRGSSPVALALSKIDLDSRPDIVVANAGDGSVSVLITSQAPATPTAMPTFTAINTGTPTATATATVTFTSTATASSTTTLTPTRTRSPTPVFTDTAPPTVKPGTISLQGSCVLDGQAGGAAWNGVAVLALVLWRRLNRRDGGRASR